ncbi:DNA mismatch repair protein Mlh3 isoform X2 [Nothoprocta perdicaria]|uniref:DNA mismatch repair protein Mlh3 isoform X2 n=1 Tax=Nothoprocta perdicaria TaxID=30464 RepID=UPI000E1BC557|nr:DNA mismatch repair protein Mlh3 isoform X2 [Nothoprocta perdicaria]
MIKCLAEDVRARLRSGVAVGSLGQCVEELVLNSIDAKATCVAVRVDLEAFKVQVVDNGSGMGREDLNKMGKRYFTSKCSSVEDLESLKYYGFRGEAVASIANMASVVEVSSKTNRAAKTFVKLFHNGQALEVCEAELSRPSGGTTVTVCNLFHQLPVRRKCMDPALEFERVRQKVEAISLMHPSVSLSLRNDASCAMVLQLPKTRDVYSRFCQIYGLGRSQKLREISHKSGGFELNGYISSEGHYNKNMQFLYVNRRLVLKTRIHKLIDFLLRKESVICKSKSVPASRQTSSSPGHHRCGPELYGIFVLSVTCQYSDYDVCLDPAKTLIEFHNWDLLLTCVEEGVKMFLKREHLFIEPCNEDIREFNEDNDFCLHSVPVQKPSISNEKGIQDSFKKACDEIVDSYERYNLQSKDVKRKSVSGKTSSFKPNGNPKETEISPDRVMTDPPDTCRNKEAKMPLPRKDSKASYLRVSGISGQEPKDTDISQKVCDTDLESSEKLYSCLGEGGRSEQIESDDCDELQLRAEDYVKETGSQQGGVVQESSTIHSVSTDFTDSPYERLEDPREPAAGPEIFTGSSVVGMCNVKKGNKETVEMANGAGRRGLDSIPLELFSAGLTTHTVQTKPPHECEQVEKSHALNARARPGPVSAKDTFGDRVNFPARSFNVKDISSNLNKEYTLSYNREMCMADGKKQLENKTLPNQLREDRAMPSAAGRRQCVTANIKALTASSAPPQNKIMKSTGEQVGEPRSQPCKKLSLSVQLGSLEKFRRYYGRAECMLSTPLPEERECGLTVLNSQAVPDSSKSQDDNHGNLSICETPGLKYTDSHTSSRVVGSLEKTLFSSKDTVLGGQALSQNKSPFPLTDCAQVSKKTVSSARSLGSLASKLSRMRSDRREAEQPGDCLQTDSSRRDNNSLNLESSNNECVPKSSQMYKTTMEKITRYYFSFSKEDTPWQLDSARAEAMDSTVSQPALSSTRREHAVSLSPVSSLPGKKEHPNVISTEESALGESTEQTLNAAEVPCRTSLSSLEFTADDARTGDAKNDSHFSDWLQDFDVSSGKTIYINRTTGLSSYSTPPAEEFQAACTKDITTMAVNVVSENDAEGESLQSLFSEWDNPVFVRCPEIAVDVTSSQAENLAVKIHNILYPYRFTKDMIHSMQVLQQVDNKFIACLINTRNKMDKKAGGNLLVLVDQHAAHERIRLEQLIADSYEKEAATCGKKKIMSSSICPPLEIEVTEEQRRLLRCCHKNLEDLGLELSFPETNHSLILVGKVPLCFIEREANELRRKRQPVAKSIVQEFIQEQVELVQTTGGARGTLPLTFLKVLASQACHGAIKFNDSLTLEESCQLIEALSSCQLPFQCAHGRPSMMPLADIDHLQEEKQPKPNLARLRKMARAWHLFGEKKKNLTKAANAVKPNHQMR